MDPGDPNAPGAPIATPWEICDVALRLAQLKGDCELHLDDAVRLLDRAEAISRHMSRVRDLWEPIAAKVEDVKGRIPEKLVEEISKRQPTQEMLSKGLTRQEALARIIRKSGMAHGDRETYFRRAYYQRLNPNKNPSTKELNIWWDGQLKSWGAEVGSENFDASGFQMIATVDQFWMLAELVAPHVPAWKGLFGGPSPAPRKKPRSRKEGTKGQFAGSKHDSDTGRFRRRQVS